MRATVAYTSARILLLVVSIILLYLVGARGLLLLALACVVSGIASRPPDLRPRIVGPAVRTPLVPSRS